MSSGNLIQNELDSWKQEHSVRFDEVHKKTSQDQLNCLKDNERLYLAFRICSLFLNFNHKHYFIVAEPKDSAPHYIEFGSSELDYVNARVSINTTLRDKTIKCEFRLTKSVRQRIEHVLGMKNFSLCLRNSEHVANYIYKGIWHSSQAESFRTILKVPMSKREIQFLNKFPSKIHPHVFIDENTAYESVYSFLPQDIQLFQPYKMEYFLEVEQDSYNILLIGPTGAGKSHLVNVIFNRKIVESDAGLDGITDEIVMIKCMGKIYDYETNQYMDRKIIVTDTIGLSDRRWNEANSPNLLQFLKERISSNFRKFDLVYIVFSNDRLLLEPIENIRNVLKWLNYERNSTRVRFIITKADYLDESDKINLKKEAIQKFNIKQMPRTEFKPNDDYFIYFTGFIPELEDNMTKKKKDRITQEFRALYDNMRHCDDSNRIDAIIDTNNRACTIL